MVGGVLVATLLQGKLLPRHQNDLGSDEVKQARRSAAEFYVHEDRECPDNFDPAVATAFKQLPAECLPPGASRGRLSFTIKNSHGARVEIQLNNKAFYIKGISGGQPVDFKPSVAWVSFDSLEEVWAHVKSLVQWGGL